MVHAALKSGGGFRCYWKEVDFFNYIESRWWGGKGVKPCLNDIQNPSAGPGGGHFEYLGQFFETGEEDGCNMGVMFGGVGSLRMSSSSCSLVRDGGRISPVRKLCSSVSRLMAPNCHDATNA